MQDPLLDPARDALFLDFDGTLVEIAAEPASVIVPQELPLLLEQLWQRFGGALAIVSGRTIFDIDRLLSPITLPAAGIHGAELRPTAGAEITAESGAIPPAVRAEVHSLADQPGILVEDKGISLAVHYRAAEPEIAQSACAIVERLSSANGLTVLMGKRVIELKATRSDKGSALVSLMRLPPFLGRRPVFVGDDITDDHAFARLPELGGVGISVTTKRPNTAWTFATPADVRNWLSGIHNVHGQKARE